MAAIMADEIAQSKTAPAAISFANLQSLEYLFL